MEGAKGTIYFGRLTDEELVRYIYLTLADPACKNVEKEAAAELLIRFEKHVAREVGKEQII